MVITIIELSLGYHNLKLEKKSSYLTTFTCPFGKYIFTTLQLGVLPAGDMFPEKIDEIFKDLQNVFGITDVILVVGYGVDGRDIDRTLR